MNRSARTLFFTALAVVLAPFALSGPAEARGATAPPSVVPAPVEHDCHPVTYATRTVFAEAPSERLPDASGAPAPLAESSLAGPVVVSCGVSHAVFRCAGPLRPLHPARAPPQLF